MPLTDKLKIDDTLTYQNLLTLLTFKTVCKKEPDSYKTYIQQQSV